MWPRREWEREWTKSLFGGMVFGGVCFVLCIGKRASSMEHPCAHCYSFFFFVYYVMLCCCCFFFLSRPLIWSASDFCINKCDFHRVRQLYDRVVQITVNFYFFFTPLTKKESEKKKSKKKNFWFLFFSPLILCNLSNHGEHKLHIHITLLSMLLFFFWLELQKF